MNLLPIGISLVVILLIICYFVFVWEGAAPAAKVSRVRAVLYGDDECPFFRETRKVWDTLGKRMTADNQRLEFAIVDCGAHTSVCENRRVIWFPTIKTETLFENGTIVERLFPRQGLRTEEHLENFVKDAFSAQVQVHEKKGE